MSLASFAHLKIFARVVALAGLSFVGFGLSATAEPYSVGPKKCQDCHIAEAKVWNGTAHFQSYKTVHKDKRAKKIVRAIGDKRMKKSKTCKICHYTEAKKDAGAKARLVAGPSCESCHGAASDWIAVHNEYGKGVKRAAEPADHKAARIKKSVDAGMVRPERLFDVASNCMGCHGLPRNTAG